ncbi:MAG: hypothetical protein KDA51_08385 [Planctomycetales bacterium]|nr:hypothetical protein [Planctomycetales bacterium]
MTSPSPPPFLACLACGRVTPLPPQISTRAVVRCPHCHTQFSLQDLLAEPTATWELVSDNEPDDLARVAGSQLDGVGPAVSNHRSPAMSAADELEDDYTYVEPSMETEAPVSPGAKTVQMPGYETLAENWQEEELEEELFEPVADILFDSNRAASDSTLTQPLDEYVEHRIEEAPPRKLEGPLVGEFPDDPPHTTRWSPSPADSNLVSGSSETAQESLDKPALGQSPGERPNDAPPSQNRRTRQSPPRRSPIWSVLQIILGGLAAIPISLLLMWHLLGTDVGEAAPWVAQYAPWIVPKKFHPYSPAPSHADFQPQTTFDPSGSGPLPVLPAADVDIAAELPDSVPDEFPTVEPRALSEPDLSLEATPNHRRSTDAFSAAEPTRDESELKNIVPGPSPRKESSTELAPVDLEPTLLEICFAGIRQTEQRLEEWPKAFKALRDDSNSRSQLAKLAHVTYGELTGLAMVIDEVSNNHEMSQVDAVLRAVRERLDRIGRLVKQESEVRGLIEKGSRFWVQNHLNSPMETLQDTDKSEAVAVKSKSAAASPATASPVYGLAMAVELDSVRQSADGQWWLATPTLATQLGEPTLEIRIPRDFTIAFPEDTLAKGQSLFLLGTVRPLPEEAVIGSNEAPQAQPFVASYIYPL